jgi:hypothetical protein
MGNQGGQTVTQKLVALLAIAAWAMVILLLGTGRPHAHDHERPELDEWFQTLMQPDVPNASCCGEADAYWADEFHVREGKTFAVVTDDRPDAPLKRPHVDIGTEVEIPVNKLKWDKSNPTGHGVVFLSRSGYVFCYVQPGGV